MVLIKTWAKNEQRVHKESTTHLSTYQSIHHSQPQAYKPSLHLSTQSSNCSSNHSLVKPKTLPLITYLHIRWNASICWLLLLLLLLRLTWRLLCSKSVLLWPSRLVVHGLLLLRLLLLAWGKRAIAS